ncbi:MAG: prepilin-type N-terminal cleavage/methylation domain-containing protein [Candidatus Omnitrophota bacterium]|nr:prepilin-type N-terminal cleavage/methylation domain-containing protein [Candidatus Omnitrophota bacterium]
MLPFLRIYPSKKNKLNSGAFTPLEAGCHRQPSDTCGVLSLTGFTLVELLIAVSIFSVVSIAIYSTFSSGAAILRRVKDIDLAQQRILLKTERFSRELREQAVYKKKLFSGAKTKIIFPGNSDYLPCRITYYYDPSSFCLMRVVDKLSAIITPEGKVDAELKSKPQVFLSEIKEAKFSYLFLDLKKNVYSWTEEWLQAYLPLAVKLTIISENYEHASTIFLPTA